MDASSWESKRYNYVCVSESSDPATKPVSFFSGSGGKRQDSVAVLVLSTLALLGIGWGIGSAESAGLVEAEKE